MSFGEILTKFAIVGDEKTGKSSIVEQYLRSNYYENNISTIGVDIVIKN